MSTLTLRATRPSPYRLNLFGIVPNRLAGLTQADIRQLPIGVETGTGRLGDWFELIDGEREKITFAGDVSNCDGLGGGLESGLIEIDGNVGDFLADRMTSGELIVRGSAGRYACSSLRGGHVSIEGNCGEFAAAGGPPRTRGN